MFCSRCGDALEEGCDLWDQFAGLDALLERLRLKCYDLKRKINRLQSPIVHQLPPDVMSTIFEFCLPDFAVHQLYPYPKDDLSIPLSLGAICNYWREIAWSTPSLWSSLVVRVPSKYDSHMATGIAQEWLARSGRLPLSICILSTSYNDAVSALADIINQYSARWSDLDLYIPDHYYQRFYATDNHAPIFKSTLFRQRDELEISAANLSMFGESWPFNWMEPISNVTNLTHLTLHSMSVIDSFCATLPD